MPGLLIVTAVEAERAAIADALPAGSAVRVIAGGVGPAAAAAAASASIAEDRPQRVLSAGIAGGFAPLAPGGLAVATQIAFADLGAESDAGFVPVSELGFGTDRYAVDGEWARTLAAATGGRLGTILTVATVTGTAATADRLRARYPDAVAEAMEGAGVAAAAERHGVPCGELRAISNAVGPRERASWRIPEALAALSRAVAAVAGQWPS